MLAAASDTLRCLLHLLMASLCLVLDFISCCSVQSHASQACGLGAIGCPPQLGCAVGCAIEVCIRALCDVCAMTPFSGSIPTLKEHVTIYICLIYAIYVCFMCLVTGMHTPGKIYFQSFSPNPVSCTFPFCMRNTCEWDEILTIPGISGARHRPDERVSSFSSSW